MRQNDHVPRAKRPRLRLYNIINVVTLCTARDKSHFNLLLINYHFNCIFIHIYTGIYHNIPLCSSSIAQYIYSY